ncbi:unnamed protein product [marine sediment metagenome]|uniref:Helix-turn-helix domain-containing protein n=1 Tax=marine sediment metagenome TaxID=412755 RepID=X1VRT7_9ZZZZ
MTERQAVGSIPDGARATPPASPEGPPTPAQTPGGVLIGGLARLPEKTILNGRQLASILKVTPRTVRRMVRRNELPPPVPLAGNSVWLVGRVLAHIEAAAERAAREAERDVRRISRLSP